MKNAIYKRSCPSCDTELSDDTQICSSCGKTLFETMHTPMKAGLIGYLWGGLAGGIALAVVKLIEYFFGFSERALEMIVFGLVAISAWKAKKDKLLKPKDLANIKLFETQETKISKADDGVTEKSNDNIVQDLRNRKLKPSKYFTIAGVLLVVLFGTALVILTSNLISSWSTESAVSSMVTGGEKMKNEKGPLGFIIRIAAHIVGVATPLFPILIPAIWTILLSFFSGMLVSIITYLTNFRNLKILLCILLVQAIIGGVLFDISHFSNIINKDWTFWGTIVLIPLVFILFYCSIPYSITSLFSYCTVCGGKLSKNLEGVISNENETALLRLLRNSETELLDKIELISPNKFKEHIKIDAELCPKNDNSDCKITVWRVREKNIDNSSETTISKDLWFSTVVPFEVGREIDSRWRKVVK
jgi:hypothetical protein